MNPMQTPAEQMNLELLLDPIEDFARVPGLLRRWEIAQVVTTGAEYRIEEAGELADKTQVFAVYRREHGRSQADRDLGVPVGLSFEDGQLNVRARVLPISGGESWMAMLVLGESPEDAATLARIREHLSRSGAPTGHASDDRHSATTVAQEGAIP
jgi:hypothetical protein